VKSSVTGGPVDRQTNPAKTPVGRPCIRQNSGGATGLAKRFLRPGAGQYCCDFVFAAWVEVRNARTGSKGPPPVLLAFRLCSELVNAAVRLAVNRTAPPKAATAVRRSVEAIQQTPVRLRS
jgi:hypothetical protein